MWKLLLSILGLGAALAQQVSPQGILVNPVPTDLVVRVWVDKDPARRGGAVYQIGEPIFVYVNVNQDVYVYLFNLSADGRVDPILPNAFERGNFLRAGETRRFPPERAGYTYTVTGPEGEDRILAVASRRPLSLGELLDIERGQVRVQGAEGLARALAIVVEPLPPRDWVTDVARYFVGRASAPPPTPATATLVVDSRPSGAEVYLNGRLQGRTPLTLPVNPGRQEVELRLAGHQPYRVAVNPRPGERVQVFAQLVPEPRQGTLSLASNPAGAEVYLDGALRGRTPLSLSLPEGRYGVELRLPGHEPYRAQVQVRRGETTRLDVRLVPLRTGTLLLESIPSGAEVYLDGALRGRTPLRLSLEEGTYRVELRAPGHEPYGAAVRVEGGRETRLSASLRPLRTGELFLEARPAGAEVYVDGRLVGRAPLRVSLEAGLREVRVLAPGFAEYRAQVEVRPGESLRLFVELVPARAVLELYLNAEARVFLNGEEVGLARGGYLRLEAPLGEHELTLVAPGYRTLVQGVRLAGNQVLRLTLRPL
ncbi:PEGA domain-containing protein [Thermus thermamylovorans]|uniref:PEGA domain-containing protein n=1 Tax=Thermus thermamylovorans TaxID=2509362 RepID=A0A4Q9B5A0_9DEIN|nr:PEGA domain-containing protein [Thermus thermamylovorans]TBH20773.1 PEGA domain-containing protein [Thermus thermamylovorans]